ncbi:hypothetical protein AGMMS4957_01480 [Bacteroidia bacterium]|nr:hypothetical protein AGMMS4957_01480 [Bacteroidia bacterium]
MKIMKKIINYISAGLLMVSVASCDVYETWGEGDPALEHTYYVGPVKTNLSTEQLEYEIDAAGVARWKKYELTSTAPVAWAWEYSDETNVTTPIPIRFISERIRSYNVVSYFWITSALTAGTDYSVLAGDGTPLTPNAQGAYSLTWPQAKKGVQSVKIKRLSAAAGALKLNALNPDLMPVDRNNLETLLNNQTSDYVVKGISFDYNTLTITFL